MKMLAMLALVAVLDPTMGVPVTPTANQGPAIVINECRLLAENGQPVSQLLTTSSGIQIQFTNETQKTAQLVNFRVSDVHQSAVIRDVGTFSPGITIVHKYKIGAGETYSPLFDAPTLRCTVDSIKFDDGTVWRNDQPPLQTGNATPSPVAMTGGFIAYPNHLLFSGAGIGHDLFLVAQSDTAGTIEQANTCGSIAQVSFLTRSSYATVFRVTPASAGSCIVTLRDRANHTIRIDVVVNTNS
jgi:hypothetical protein